MKKFKIAALSCLVAGSVLTNSAFAQVDSLHDLSIEYRYFVLADSDGDGLSDLYEVLTGDVDVNDDGELSRETVLKRQALAPNKALLSKSGLDDLHKALDVLKSSGKVSNELALSQLYEKSNELFNTGLVSPTLTQAELDLLKSQNVTDLSRFVNAETLKARLDVIEEVEPFVFEMKPELLDETYGIALSAASTEGTVDVPDNSAVQPSDNPLDILGSRPTEAQPNLTVLPFSTKYVENYELEPGVERLVQQGFEGSSVDGKVVVEPVDAIIEYGPKVDVIKTSPSVEYRVTDQLPYLDVQVSTQGVEGVKKVFYNRDGEVIAEQVVSEATDGIVLVGNRLDSISSSVVLKDMSVGSVVEVTFAAKGSFGGQTFDVTQNGVPVKWTNIALVDQKDAAVELPVTSLSNLDVDLEMVKSVIEAQGGVISTPGSVVIAQDVKPYEGTVKPKDVPYKIVSKYDETLKKGERKVVRKGLVGINNYYYDQEGHLLGTITEREPLDELVSVGSKEDAGTVDSNSNGSNDSVTVTPDSSSSNVSSTSNVTDSKPKDESSSFKPEASSSDKKDVISSTTETGSSDKSVDKPADKQDETKPVQKDDVIESKKTIPFTKRTIEDVNLPSGERRIIQEGQNGEYATVLKPDGTRKLVTLKHPVAEVTAVGTVSKPAAGAASSSMSSGSAASASSTDAAPIPVARQATTAQNGQVATAENSNQAVLANATSANLLPLTGEQLGLAIVGVVLAVVGGGALLFKFMRKTYDSNESEVTDDDDFA